MVKNQERSLLLQSHDDVIQAMEITDCLAESVGFPPKEKILLRLVTEEAAVNALDYGRKNSQEPIEVNWNTSHTDFAISVKQKGERFQIKTNHLLNVGARGRGPQLILNIMDHVWLEEVDESIILHMEKKVS